MQGNPESWFTYDQFEFVAYNWAPKGTESEKAADMLYAIGIITGIIAAVGGWSSKIPYAFEIAGSIHLCLYAFRFFAFLQTFTNHNYLFLLLGILLVISGGGKLHPLAAANKKDEMKNKIQLHRIIQKSEWGAIMIRIQYAIVYFFASLWKLITPDWMDGTICKGIFLSFEEQGVNRGVPWKLLYEQYGDTLFQMVALGGLILDTGMFAALTFRRPNHESIKLLTVLSIMFHSFTCFTMSQRIGYMFPLCCLSGSLILYPIGNDGSTSTTTSSRKKQSKIVKERDEGNLIEWVQRYWTGSSKARASPGQRQFALFWVAFQLAMPLRMPFLSRGNWPYTAQCYRFSWTMMLHSKSNRIIHSGHMAQQDGSKTPFFLGLEFMNLYPECAPTMPIQRATYSPPDALSPFQDPRSIPLDMLSSIRQRAVIDQFPRHIARVGGGWSNLMYQQSPQACHNMGTGEYRPIAVYASVFSKLNDKGAYNRLLDPTVDVAAMERARRQRSVWGTLRDVLLDKAPSGYEFLLMDGIGSMNDEVDAYRESILKKYPLVQRVEFIADRSSCLAARPITLWPNGFSLGAILLQVPSHVKLQLVTRMSPPNMTPQQQWDGLLEPNIVKLQPNTPTLAMGNMVEFSVTEIGVDKNGISIAPSCADTKKEDILIALLFMA